MTQSPIQQRLASARDFTEKGLNARMEDKKRILKERAMALALDPMGKEAPQEVVAVVEFGLGGETYAIETMYVREVYAPKELVPLPCTPVFVLGIINVRGQILSVIDLKHLFDLQQDGGQHNHLVIVVSFHEMELGISVDSIRGARSIPSRGIHPPVSTLEGLRADYSKGITSEGVVILHTENLLRDQRILVHEEVEK